jgi:hypothetical protein
MTDDCDEPFQNFTVCCAYINAFKENFIKSLYIAITIRIIANPFILLLLRVVKS